MEEEQLIERVADIAETTFQDYNTEHTYERIV